MKRALPIVVLLVALAAGGVTFSAASARAAAPPPSVTIVLAPYLTWSDVTPETTPVLWRLAGSGAVGNVGARIRVQEPGDPPSPLEGALTMSAGNWAIPDYSAPSAFNATETVGSLTAADAYQRQTGRPMTPSAIAYLGLPGATRLNASTTAGTVLGTLGSAVRTGGGLTAAVGNSDSGARGDLKFMRPAGIAAMDESGLVALGDVSRDLLVQRPSAPYGIATDLPALVSALAAIRSRLSTSTGPALIVVDPGDPYRARRFAPQVSPPVASAQGDAALTELDSVVGVAEAQQPPGGVLVVVAQGLLVEPSGAPQGFGPLIVSGTGWHGYLTSGSTHRPGMATELDVTATTLQVLGLRRPVQVSGNPLALVPAPSDARARIAYLSALDQTALALDSRRAMVMRVFLVLVAFSCVVVALVFAVRPRLGVRLGNVVAGLGGAVVLFAASVPVSSWLLFIVVPHPADGTRAIQAMFSIAFAVTLAAILVGRWLAPRAALAAVAALTVGTLVVDQWFGAPLSYTGFFGYSPLAAARYYGMGNEAAALCLGAALVGVALVLDEWRAAPWTGWLRRYGVALLGAVVVVTASAPFWGANIGVAVWGTVGFVVAWALLNDRRVSWKTAVFAALLVALLIGVLAAFDLFGGGEQTHLGRSLVSAAQGGVGELWIIVARKAQTNVRVLSRTSWSWLLVDTLGLLVFLRVFFRERFSSLLAANSQFLFSIVAATVAGTLAFFTEDSGIVVTSLIALFVAMGLAWLALNEPTDGERT